MNKLGIRDEETLHEAETLVTFISASKLEQHPLGGAFDVAHYKAIHYFLCSDLYDWAGQIRRVNIGKKGTRFTLAENIECQAASIFHRLKECDCYGECKGCGCSHPFCIDWREYPYSHPAGHLCCLPRRTEEAGGDGENENRRFVKKVDRGRRCGSLFLISSFLGGPVPHGACPRERHPSCAFLRWGLA